MGRLLILIRAGFARFERWFDRHCGWFFTNGMKGHRCRPHSFKA
ncbi:MAG: hypothetical protein QM724_02815 [Flavobacteriales bacterium]